MIDNRLNLLEVEETNIEVEVKASGLDKIH